MYTNNFETRFDAAACLAAAFCDYWSSFDLYDHQCYWACYNEACLFSAGMCFTPCYERCELCYGSGNGSCFKCKAGSVMYFGYCLDDCPRGYAPHKLLSWLCTRPATLPELDEIYITASRTGLNKGTADDPMWSMFEGLLSMYAETSVIHFLKGQHNIFPGALESPTSFVYFKSPTNPFNSLKSLQIKSVLCSSSSHPQCTDEPATLVLNYLWFSLSLSNVAVTIDQMNIVGPSTLVQGCSSLQCTYCPTVTLGSDGTYLDDRGQVITEFGDASVCEAFSLIAFFHVTGVGSKIIVSNTKFRDIRFGIGAIISVVDGDVELSKVDFINCQPSYRKGSLLNSIVQISCSKGTCGSLTMTDSSVSLMNNGHEFSLDHAFTGFLAASNSAAVTISNSEFSLNYVSNKHGYGHFISLTNCFSFVLTDSEFSNNVVTGSTIYLANSSLNLGDTTAQQDQVHVQISATSFRNSGSTSSTTGGLISATYVGGDQHNIEVKAVTVSDFIGEYPIVLSYIPETQLLRNTAGSLMRDGTSRPKTARFVEVRLSRVYASRVLSATSIANFEMNKFELLSSGQPMTGSSVDIGTSWTAFVDAPEAYAQRPITGQYFIQTSDLIKLTKSHGLTLTEVTIEDNYSRGGTAGLKVEDNLGTFTSSQVSFKGNMAYGDAVCLYYQGVEVTLSGLTLLSNTQLYPLGGIVYVISSTLHLRQMTAAMNSSSSSLILSISSNISATELICESNTAQFASCIAVYIANSAIYLKVFDSLFKGNRGDESAAIELRNSQAAPALMTLEVSRSVFANNHGVKLSSVLLVLAAVEINAVFTAALFEGNSAVNYGAVLVNSRRGFVKFVDCSFNDNRGQHGIGISLEATPTALNSIVVSLSNTQFLNNVGISVLYARGQTNFVKLETLDTKLSNNQACLVYTDFATWTDDGSTISDNISTISPGYLSNYSAASLTSTVFTRNKNPGSGGSLTLSIGTQLECRSCQFTYAESGVAGCISTEKYSRFVFSDTLIAYNKSEYNSAIVAVYSYGNILRNCVIKYNHSLSDLIQLTTSDLTVEHTVIRDNTADINPAVHLTSSSFTAFNATFANQTGQSVSFFQARASSKVSLTEVSVFNVSAIADSGFMYLQASSARLTNCIVASASSANAGFAMLASR
jgi:hypothetical protein